MPITKATASSIAPAAKGDLVVGSATNDAAVLAVGSNDQVLTADSSTATGLKWAAVATPASGLTFISRTTFSNVASIAIDSAFSSSYEAYKIIIENCTASTSGDDLWFQLRYSGTTETSGNYYGNFSHTIYNSGSWTVGGFTGETKAIIADGTDANFMSFDLFGLGQTTEFAYWHGTGSNYQGKAHHFGGVCVAARTYTGILFKSASSNITGQISIYGYAKA
jgi:hypothetical protein